MLNSKFILGILTSILNLKALFEDLQEEGFSYILTNPLSQDGLENFFSVVRAMGGANSNPSAAEFACRFR